MTPRRKSRLYLAVVMLMGAALIVTLVLYALSSNIDLFYTPREILEGKGENQQLPHIGQRLRIGGMVMPGSVKRDPHTLKVTFRIYDAVGSVPVSYDGILPDLFREGQGVVAQGVLGVGNLVQAREVLAKHDENYTPPEVKDAMKPNHRPAGQHAMAEGTTRGRMDSQPQYPSQPQPQSMARGDLSAPGQGIAPTMASKGQL